MQRHQTPTSETFSHHSHWSADHVACLHCTAEAMVCIWSGPQDCQCRSSAARGRGHADPRSPPTQPAVASRCAARRGRWRSPPGGLQCREPAPCRAGGYDAAGPLARNDEHGRRPRGRAWHLRGELPYGQGGYRLGQIQLPGDSLGRSQGGAAGDAAGDRQGRHSGGRRHRRSHQGSTAGYLGAIGGCLQAVRSQAATRLASTLADPSPVRGTGDGQTVVLPKPPKRTRQDHS